MKTLAVIPARLGATRLPRKPLRLLGGDNRFQLLVNGPRPTPDTVGEYMMNELRTVIGHDGKPTRALYSEVRQSGCCGTAPQGGGSTQDALHLLPGTDSSDVYVSKWMKFQPNLAENMSSGGPWRVVFEFKEGGGSMGGGGAFRQREPASGRRRPEPGSSVTPDSWRFH